jgi:hypothetical protein
MSMYYRYVTCLMIHGIVQLSEIMVQILQSRAGITEVTRKYGYGGSGWFCHN